MELRSCKRRVRGGRSKDDNVEDEMNAGLIDPANSKLPVFFNFLRADTTVDGLLSYHTSPCTKTFENFGIFQG